MSNKTTVKNNKGKKPSNPSILMSIFIWYNIGQTIWNYQKPKQYLIKFSVFYLPGSWIFIKMRSIVYRFNENIEMWGKNSLNIDFHYLIFNWILFNWEKKLSLLVNWKKKNNFFLFCLWINDRNGKFNINTVWVIFPSVKLHFSLVKRNQIL